MRAALRSAGTDQYPRWSPDGSKIAFASLREGQLQIYVMNSDGRAQVNVSQFLAAEEDLPTWSSDGRRIAFQSMRDGALELYAVDVTTGVVSRLTNNGSYDTHAAWRPR